MDIIIYNTITYLTYLIDNNLTINNQKILYDLVMNKLIHHNFMNKNLLDNLKKNISEENKGNIINYDIPNLMKEFTAINTGVISYFVDYMETKKYLTDYI